MHSEESLSKYILDSENLEINSFKKKIKVAFLSSFTINGLSESLKVKCSKRQISCNQYVANYNQYNQEILDKKNLSRKECLLLPLRTIAKALKI